MRVKSRCKGVVKDGVNVWIGTRKNLGPFFLNGWSTFPVSSYPWTQNKWTWLLQKKIEYVADGNDEKLMEGMRKDATNDLIIWIRVNPTMLFVNSLKL
jgi:hypothetical protein